MQYIPAVNFKRSRAFDTCVGQLEQDLNTKGVRDALGEQATREFLDITRRLEPASVKNSVVSIGRRAIRDGKVALAFLSDDEAHAFHIAPNLLTSMLPEQKEHYNKLPIYPADKIIETALSRVAAELVRRAPLKSLDCGGELFHTLDGAYGATGANHSSLRNFREEYSVAFRPTIVMRLPNSGSRNLQRYNADTLLHEERHVLQVCQAPHALPASPQAKKELESQTRFRYEVEAHHQEAVYQKAVGMPLTSLLESMRKELGVPVIQADGSFDIYKPLMEKFGNEGLAWLHGEDPSHAIGECCIQSLMISISKLRRF